jgi:Zn-dependent protease with chaperone function
VDSESRARRYAREKRRINIVGAVVFLAVSLALILGAQQLWDVAWSAWWLVPSGLLLGFALALAVCMALEHALGRRYGQVDLPLWEYVLVRFRFLLILFIVPTALVLLVGIVYINLVPVESASPLYWIVPRLLALVVLIPFAGYVLPYLFQRAVGAERATSPRLRALVNEVSAQMGTRVQQVYVAPLEGLRGANAAQVGFVEGHRAVTLLGEWEERFAEGEIVAVLAHEFAHAKHHHAGKLTAIEIFSRTGVPALLYLGVWLAIRLCDLPRPPSLWVVIVITLLAVALFVGALLYARRLARAFERQADAEAARVAGRPAMISTLEKLAALNLIPREQQHLLSTHPSMQARIEALRDQG